MGLKLSTPTTLILDAAVDDAIVNGEVIKAPSQNAVFDALALKAPLASPTFTTSLTAAAPTFTGQITTAAGTGSAPAIVGTGDAATGLYWNGSQTLQFVAGSSGNQPWSIDNNGMNLHNGKRIRLYDTATETCDISAPADITTSYTITIPPAQGAANTVMKNNGSGVLTWVTDGSIAYTVADTNDWPGADPTTIKAALDLLAARLNVLEP